MYSSHPYYGFFMRMISRGRKFGSDFKFGKNEFYRWLVVIGDIPGNIVRPTVGRYDHSKGYVFDTELNRWNFRWQEYSENCRENGNRAADQGKTPFQTGAQGRRTSELGKTGMQTGAAQRAAVLSPNHLSKQVLTCPHPDCGVTGTGPIMKRWHFDNCKKKS